MKKLEELEAQIQYMEMQLEDARKTLHGTIEAKGFWAKSMTPNGIIRKWDINVSDILTKLIQQTGQLCDRYASDLFILWASIQKKLDDGSMTNSKYVFAIRESGVDHDVWYEINKDIPHYYRAVWFLDVEVNGEYIYMILHR